MKRGFTLIELLVVVLIIGILAAIALPQYQKAVLRSRFNGMMPTAKSIATAEEAYYMEHGSYGPLDALDVKMNSTEGISVAGTGTNRSWYYVMSNREDLPNNRLVIYLNHSRQFPKEIHCEASSDAQAKKLCKESLGGEYVGIAGDGWSAYRLNMGASGNGIPRGLDLNGDGHFDGTDLSVSSEDDSLTDEQSECMMDIVLSGDSSCGKDAWPEE